MELTWRVLAADWWGIHMATDVGPLTHWNASSGDFEDGTSAFQIQYPVTHMVSDGDELLSVGSQNNLMLSEARTNSHAFTTSLGAMGATTAILGANHIWAITDESDSGTMALQAWERTGQFTPVDSTSMRRALPLTVRTFGGVGVGGGGLNITTMTHPGMQIDLVDPSSAYALDLSLIHI